MTISHRVSSVYRPACARRDQEAIDELFQYGCPKFVSPVAPDYDVPDPEEQHAPYRMQLKMFRREVQQQSMLATIRSYLKLYSSLSIVRGPCGLRRRSCTCVASGKARLPPAPFALR